MKHNLIFLKCIVVILICLSCSQREAYYHYHEIKGARWSKYDTLIFNIDSTAIVTNTAMNIDLEIVNNSDYPYQNIWFHIEDDFSNSNQLEKYNVQYELANNEGKWSGSGFGSLFQLTLKCKKNVFFTEKRNYRLKMVQKMRDEPLIGIEKIGLRVSFSE